MKRIELIKGYSLSLFPATFGGLNAGNFAYQDRLIGEKVYLVKIDASYYTIEAEDGVVLDNVEMRNGVAHYEHRLSGNYLHTLAQYGLAEANDGLPSLLVASKKEALDKAVKKQPGEYHKVVQKLLGGEEETTNRRKGGTKSKQDKLVEPDCDAAVLLSAILANCPKASVEWVGIPKVKELKNYTHVPESLSECVAFLKLVRYLRCTTGTKNEGGEWHYTSTQREFNAVVMMQSYTNAFTSCQYFPVHALSSGEVADVVEDCDAFAPLIPKCKDSMEDQEGGMYGFLSRQWQGFEKGVRYYFKLGKQGLISKRFYVFGDEQKISNNFYQLISRSCAITHSDGSVAMVSPFRGSCPEMLPVYMNDSRVEASLPDEITEGSVRKYLLED